MVLHGLSVSDFQAQPSVPVFLKKRDIIMLNEIDRYFDQLSGRIASGRADEQAT